jgi:hypothetical protein
MSLSKSKGKGNVSKLIEQHILDTNAGKQLSQGATDV